ncbi:MAG: TatD family deoxyribonuclease [Burkholderiaceae bacterium]|jgi:TatD DNase family protein|nr:MAG: TatD family deoxyribonuclease [Burkholderiaceae bacterium]
MFTDSHCHLAAPELIADVPQIQQAMAAARVTRALCVSTTMEGFPAVQALAARYDNLWATVGLHPEDEGHEPSVDELVGAAALAKVVAIGETGLDYYRLDAHDDAERAAVRERQRERFRTHIRAARRAHIPLVIHTRAASDDTLALLDEEGEDGTAGCAGGVFHCFTESLEVARAALDRGFYVSFSGIVTFKNAREVQAVVPYVPDDRLLIETDSPYLAPVPFRGKRNTPAYVPHVAARVAELRGATVEHIAEQTSANFTRLFLRERG